MKVNNKPLKLIPAKYGNPPNIKKMKGRGKGFKKEGEVIMKSKKDRQKADRDRWTNRETNGQTDRQTDKTNTHIENCSHTYPFPRSCPCIRRAGLCWEVSCKRGEEEGRHTEYLNANIPTTS